jgi:WD40 repeat protein
VNRIVSGGDNLVVTGSEDHTVRVWDAATGEHRHRLDHGHWVRDIALSPDGKYLASNSLDDTVCLWDAATGRVIYRLAGHGKLGGQRAVAFSRDGKSFLAWGDDFYLREWDIRTGKALLEYAIRPSGIEVPAEDAEPFGRDRFFHLEQSRFTPDGKHLILTASGHFFVFDVTTGKEVRTFAAEGSTVIGLDVSPDGKVLLASAWGKQVETKLPDGEIQYSPPKDHPVTWWDLATGKRLGQVLLPEEGMGPVAFAPDGKTFAVATRGQGPSCIRIVELADGKVVRKIEGFRSVVRSLAFLPDGKRLVSGMEDSTALIWDLTR